MNLYLVRHADAVDAEIDPNRPLSERGRNQVRAVARLLAPGGVLRPEEIWHSPLVRARETAVLLKEQLGLAAPLVETPELEPDVDPQVIAIRLRSVRQRIAIVGHEPHLSALASLLVAREAQPPVFVMKKGAVLTLEGAAEHWAVRWHVSPELIGS
jgi:phosphohistidine phosphatase